MNENDVIIDVKDLHKSYGQTEVIKGVDMTVRKGEVICIIGPSGAGKSTILRCLNGLEQATGSSFAQGRYCCTAPIRKIRNLSHFLDVCQRVEIYTWLLLHAGAGYHAISCLFRLFTYKNSRRSTGRSRTRCP